MLMMIDDDDGDGEGDDGLSDDDDDDDDLGDDNENWISPVILFCLGKGEGCVN